MFKVSLEKIKFNTDTSLIGNNIFLLFIILLLYMEGLMFVVCPLHFFLEKKHAAY